DLLPGMLEHTDLEPTDLEPAPLPHDELSVAEIGLAETRPGTLLLYPPSAIGKPWPELAPRRTRSRRRLLPQLPGAVKRAPTLRSTRGAGIALVAIVIAAAVLSRAPGGGVGSVYPAGAAGALLTAGDLGDTWAEGGL